MGFFSTSSTAAHEFENNVSSCGSCCSFSTWSLRKSSSYWTYNRRGEWELASSRGRTAADEIFIWAWDFRGNKAEERERERISSCDQLPQGLIMALLAKWCCRGRESEEMWVVSSFPLFWTSSVLPTTLLKVSSSGEGDLTRIMWKQRLGWSYTEVLQDWIWPALLLPPLLSKDPFKLMMRSRVGHLMI